MAVIKMTQMGGLYPSSLPRALPNEGAQAAENLNPGTNEFRPLPADTQVATGLSASNPKTLYRFDRNVDGTLNTSEASGWRADARDLSLVRQQLNDDTTGRIYYASNDSQTSVRWTDATGKDAPAAVPFPVSKLGVALIDGYVFTPELKEAELASALDKAVAAANAALAPTLVGLGNTVDNLSPGWLRASWFGGSDVKVLRVFAVNPGTLQIIDTYSTMPPQEAGWVLDPNLKGYYTVAPPGYTPPAWATGHTAWWCLEMRGFARAYTVNQALMYSNLAAIDLPGSQGEEKLLTPAQVQSFVDQFVGVADPTSPPVSDLIKQLEDLQKVIISYVSQGGAATLKEAIMAYYASSAVTTELAAADNVFAEKIWTYIKAIGEATATPWYADGA